MLVFLNALISFFSCDLFLHWFALAFIGGIICLSLNVFAFPRGNRHD